MFFSVESILIMHLFYILIATLFIYESHTRVLSTPTVTNPSELRSVCDHEPLKYSTMNPKSSVDPVRVRESMALGRYKYIKGRRAYLTDLHMCKIMQGIIIEMAGHIYCYSGATARTSCH